jgi:hypothetical protein
MCMCVYVYVCDYVCEICVITPDVTTVCIQQYRSCPAKSLTAASARYHIYIYIYMYIYIHTHTHT